MNEIVLYICLVLLFVFSGINIETKVGEMLGWAMIGFLIALCTYNTAIIVILSVRFFKLYLKRLRVNLIIKNRRLVV